MYSFGFISLNPELEDQYFTEVAKRAKPLEMTCYRFKPTNIHPITELISGEVFSPEEAIWKQAEFPLPEILYDRCFYTDTLTAKTSMAIVKWLKTRKDIDFIGHGLPNKWNLHQTLFASKLRPYVAETIKVSTAQQVLSFLDRYKKVILKPEIGSGGMGIVCLEKNEETIKVVIEKQHELVNSTYPTIQPFINWLHTLLNKKSYLAQRFLPLTDHENRPFDVRIFLQKNIDGSWVERGRGIRVGQQNGILSNLTVGAKPLNYQNWIDTLSNEKARFLNAELNEIVLQLPNVLEKHYPPLFELGVDIGIACDLSLWILDINSKPGRKVIVETTPLIEESLYTAPLKYGKQLANNRRKVRENHREKTLSD
ncbi:YheC/YheD family protein [Mesobacillus maritimus]|uniref:YheC/YheD family endospore coat-associated protein n=1 Tax=Mesobacillus maritimus TaxID=1643336 RepID=UPI00203B9B47|nr:YheC/YheD family protein [Mesobacillus maritimus]MCM3586043.1 YheC/YheD family protein [Mesobacillus maritimus]MCM3671725.1 YheC/YheD family protein [Mesobacillus maritimus]